MVISTLKDTVGLKRFTVNLFTDYAIQTGRLKGLRAGLGVRFVDKDIAGYRSGDSIANPTFNAALPASATNTPCIDDPTVDANTPVWIKRPWEATLTIDYTRRLKVRLALPRRQGGDRPSDRAQPHEQPDGVLPGRRRGPARAER